MCGNMAVLSASIALGTKQYTLHVCVDITVMGSYLLSQPVTDMVQLFIYALFNIRKP